MATVNDSIQASLAYFKGDGLAASVFATKYALTSDDGDVKELTPDLMHRRLAREFARIEGKYPNAMSEDEIYDLLVDFKKVVPQGSPMAGIGNPYQVQSISNCFVVPAPEDSYGGILLTDQRLVQIAKRRGGIGFDISKIRPKGMHTANAARTTDGIEVFMDRFSNSCREVAQNGRRGALMLTISVHHPQIRDFLKIKQNRDRVTGANISIRLSDEFLQAVEDGAKFQLRYPVDNKVDPKVSEWVDANALWTEINESAWKCAEPGLLFWDTILRESPADCYADLGYRTESTNPCVTGDTLVAVADGRGTSVTMKTLVQEGRDVPVYCCDDHGKVVVRMMRNPRLTKRDARILKVTMDDGSVLRVSDNHKLRLVDGSYREARELGQGDSLHVAFRRQLALNDVWKNSNSRSADYIWFKSANKVSVKSEHRLIYEFHTGQKVPKGSVIHHVDFDSLNNVPSNLRCMTKQDHDELHGDAIRGDANPMRRAQHEWSEEKWQQYRQNMSESTSGEKNGNSWGASNQEVLDAAVQWIREIGYIPTKSEWRAFAQKNRLPELFVTWRQAELGTISKFLHQAAEIAGVNVRRTATTSSDANEQLAYYRGITDLPLTIVNGIVCVTRTCEGCGRALTLPVGKREISFCSQACSNNRVDRKQLQSKIASDYFRTTGEEEHVSRLKVVRALSDSLGRKPTRSEWEAACSQQGVSTRLGTKYTSKNFKSLLAAADDYNHKVVSVEEDDVEDVYTGTVDDFHNYYTYGIETISQWDKPERVMVNQLQCGELPLSALDSCRLLLLNLMGFVKNPYTKRALFDFEGFWNATLKAQRLMDDMVDMELEQIDKILAKIALDPEPDEVKHVERELWTKVRAAAANGRRTGLGVTAVGDCIAALGLRYGTDESIEMVSSIYENLASAAYTSSTILAEERGAFPIFDMNKELTNPYLNRLYNVRPQLLERMRKFGRRNIALLTTAPGGTLSTQTQTTSGIECAYKLWYTRRKKITGQDADQTPDFVDQNGDKWKEFDVFHHGFKQWMDVNGKSKEDVEESPYWKATAVDVDWVQGVKLQAAAQKWIDHAISRTQNLPKDVTVDEVKKIYTAAWKAGCKGYTVYREGSRTGVLVDKEDSAKSEKVAKDDFGFHDAPKRPLVLPCDIHRVNVKGDAWTILIGLMQGRPYEIFGGKSESLDIPKHFVKGEIHKRPRKSKHSTYDLVLQDDKHDIKVKDILAELDEPNHAGMTRLLSLSLRHGAKPHYVVEQLAKGDKDADLFSFSKVVARVLKTYIQDGTKPGGPTDCPDCKAPDSLRYMEGCVSCASCGAGKCG